VGGGSLMPDQPVFAQLNLAARDMDATVAFYRRLGLPIEAEADAEHVAVTLPSGLMIEWDTTEFISQWDTGWKGSTGGSTLLGFSLPTREAVDETYADLTGAGYVGHQPPYDALWGARYAIVDDPDGNGVGLMSPVDPDRGYWPPKPPPSAT
jgi:catechol 2,3-dioxygenase-like lactoylglutathione lyase family enzyme